MARKFRQHHDRYDVSGNPEAEYVDRTKRVLVNLKGIMRFREIQRAEGEAVVHAYTKLIAEVRTDTPMNNELIRYIHRCVFGELYAWAGQWRTVRISKPGVTWPPPDDLEQAMADFEKKVLRCYPAAALQTDDEFCAAVAAIQGEFLSIHPFREGNARTIKLLTDLLASQTRRPLLRYDMSPKGRNQYIAAAKAVLNKGDNSLLERVIRDALARAIKLS